MKKNKKLYVIFSILIIVFAVSIVDKTFQNDTFFIIPIGNYVLQNGITTDEHFTWHEGLKFEHSGVFDVIIATFYNIADFNGVYIFTLIMTSLIGITLFNILLQRKNNILIAFLTTLTAIYFAKDKFTARAQIISYLMFIIEIYLIENLLETQKKRYILGLVLVSIVIANFHSSVWPMYFILFLPYIAEYLLKKFKMDNIFNKVIAEEINIKLLLITFIISLFSGLCTPTGIAPYTDMIKVLSGVSTQFISELGAVSIIANEGMFISLLMYIVILSSNNVKIKVSDLCMVAGLFLMGLMANRNTAFVYLIGAISCARMVNGIDNFQNGMDEITMKLSEKNSYITILSIVVICISAINYVDRINQSFVDETRYPVEATEYILENLDIENMRIFNHFNFGSYLEFKGVPVFIDSRSGIYCEEFNNTSILQDWLDAAYGTSHYKDIVEKYNITHMLLYKTEIINTYISEDTDYYILYEDDNFALYEKIK